MWIGPFWSLLKSYKLAYLKSCSILADFAKRVPTWDRKKLCKSKNDLGTLRIEDPNFSIIKILKKLINAAYYFFYEKQNNNNNNNNNNSARLSVVSIKVPKYNKWAVFVTVYNFST